MESLRLHLMKAHILCEFALSGSFYARVGILLQTTRARATDPPFLNLSEMLLRQSLHRQRGMVGGTEAKRQKI